MKLGSGSNFWWPELVARIANKLGRAPETLAFDLLVEFLAERRRPDGLRNIFKNFETWEASNQLNQRAPVAE